MALREATSVNGPTYGLLLTGHYWIRSWDIAAPHSFFFQAEDGIRDRTVTGVQTCALPISPRARARRARRRRDRRGTRAPPPCPLRGARRALSRRAARARSARCAPRVSCRDR